MKLLALSVLPIVLNLLTALISINIFTTEVFSQNSKISRSVFDAGFGIDRTSPNNVLKSIIGQVLTGRILQGNTRIENGFLANLPRMTGQVQFVIRSNDTVTLGQDVDVSVSIFGANNVIGTLFYRKAGEQSYKSDSLLRDTTGLAGKIPQDFVTIRGVEYYVKFIVEGTIYTYPEANPEIHPEVISVRVNILKSQVYSTDEKYKMISVPVELNDSTISSVLNDDYGTYNSIVWRIFRWEKGKYHEYDTINAKFTPGTAFWLITRTGASYDIENGQSVPSSQAYRIILDTGWNQIADPFAFPITWNSIALAHPDSVKGPYYYDGSQYQLGVSTLLPWEGYFVKNNQASPETLSVPPLEANSFPEKKSNIMSLDKGNEYQLQISAEIPQLHLKDSYNYVGLLQSANNGEDKYDYPEPPPIGDYVQLSIVDGGEQFMTNYKPIPTDGQHWEVQISSTKPSQKVQITLTE
ncbi:MAG: hypothetical protein HY707_11500, partial [Ignavibacteriae bacterium]|nr:hypothetical protein [Ignavibacteriota bacterium]